MKLSCCLVCLDPEENENVLYLGLNGSKLKRIDELRISPSRAEGTILTALFQMHLLVRDGMFAILSLQEYCLRERVRERERIKPEKSLFETDKRKKINSSQTRSAPKENFEDFPSVGKEPYKN